MKNLLSTLFLAGMALQLGCSDGSPSDCCVAEKVYPYYANHNEITARPGCNFASDWSEIKAGNETVCKDYLAKVQVECAGLYEEFAAYMASDLGVQEDFPLNLLEGAQTSCNEGAPSIGTSSNPCCALYMICDACGCSSEAQYAVYQDDDDICVSALGNSTDCLGQSLSDALMSCE